MCIKPEVSSPFSLNFRAIFHWFLISLMLIFFVFWGFFYIILVYLSLCPILSLLLFSFTCSICHHHRAPISVRLHSHTLLLLLFSLVCCLNDHSLSLFYLYDVIFFGLFSPLISQRSLSLSLFLFSLTLFLLLFWLCIHSLWSVLSTLLLTITFSLSLWDILAFSPLLSSITSLCSFYFSPILSIPLSALIGPSLSLSLFVFFPVAI